MSSARAVDPGIKIRHDVRSSIAVFGV